MSGGGHFGYAQARLQSRLGERMDSADVQRVHAARDLAGLLTSARTTGQRRYCARLAPGMDPHELERHLRHEWTALVDEVARWQPSRWRAALQWLRWLPWLPLLQKLVRGGRPPAWARSDPLLGRLVATEPALRSAALVRTALAPVRAAFATEPNDVQAAWLAHWRSLWPRDPIAARALEGIVRDVAVYDAAVRAAGTQDSRDPQRTLTLRLLRHFRRHPLSPAAAVAYLGLEGIGLLALRGGVLRRAVVEPGPA